MEKNDPIDRGRMQKPLEEWERAAEERLRAEKQAAAAQEQPPKAAESAAPQNEKAAADAQPEPAEKAALPAQDVPVQAPQEVPAAAEPAATDDSAQRTRTLGALLSLLGLGAVSAALVLWLLALVCGWPLPALLRAGSSPLFALPGAALLVLVGVLGVRALWRGLVSLFTFGRATAAASALAFLGAAAALYPAFSGGISRQTDVFYAASAALCLFFEQLADAVDAGRLQKERRAALSGTPARLAVLDDGAEVRTVVCPAADAQTRPLTPDGAARTGGRVISVLSLVIFAAALAGALVSRFVLEGSWAQAALLFSSAACAGAPLLAGLCAAVPLRRAGSGLRKRGEGHSGYAAAPAFGRTDALLLSERLLYPAEQVRVRSVRPLTEDAAALGESVLTAAAAAKAAGMAVAPALMRMLVGAENLLPAVDEWKTVNDAGICARVQGREVLFGSRSLLRQKRVDLTGRMLLEIEAKHAVEGSDFLYLAIGGAPAAMFVVEYQPQRPLAAELRALLSAGTELMVAAADPNITRDQVSEHFHLRTRMVDVLPQAQAAALETQESAPGAALCLRPAGEDHVRAVLACARLCETAHVVACVQVVGAVVGAGMALALSLLRGTQFEPFEALGAQLLWALPAALVALPRRYL